MAEPGPQAGEMDWQTDEQTGAKTAPIAAKWAEPTVSRGGVVGVVPGPHAPPKGTAQSAERPPRARASFTSRALVGLLLWVQTWGVAPGR